MFDWWWELIYSISYWINQLLDIIFKLFLLFSGSAPAEVNMEFTGRPDGNILASVFSNDAVPRWFALFVILAGCVFVVCFIIAIIRSEWAKDNKEAKLKIIISSAKGIMMLILIPAIFGLAISSITTVLNGIVQEMSGSSVSDYSFSQQLFECCFPITDKGVPNWNTSPKEMSYILDNSGKSLQDYNYLVAYVGGLIMLFTVGISVLTVIGRIIELVLLYIISPVVFTVTPLDEGNRMGIWKDLVISKFLSVAGMVICYYIFFVIMGYVNTNFFVDNNSFTIRIAKLVFAIAGCLTANKGGLLITNLVGHNTALIEGQQQGIMGQTVMSGAMAGLRLTTSVVSAMFGGKGGIPRKPTQKPQNNTGTNSSSNTANALSNLDGGTGVKEVGETAKLIQNSQNGSTFKEKASTYNAGKDKPTGENKTPLGEFSKGEETPSMNTGETMRAGEGFGSKTTPAPKTTLVDVAIPDSPTVTEIPAPSVMSTAGTTIKDIMEEGKNLKKGDSDQK